MSGEIVQNLLGSFQVLLPEGILGIFACILFLGATFKGSRDLWGTIALIGLILAGIFLLLSPGSPVSEAGSMNPPLGPVVNDSLAMLIRWLALIGGAVLVLLSWNEVPDEHAAEYHGCLLVAVAGLAITGLANDLVTLFLALELISIPTYIALYLPRHDAAAQEAAMKYFLLSVFSSALLLFGFSYLYGLSGTTSLPDLVKALTGEKGVQAPAVALIALVMVAAGLGFRITAVPFHYYAPDVYQGAPTAGAALLAFLPKVSGFAAFLRVMGLVSLGSGAGLVLGKQISVLFWIIAVVTMTLGNVLALLQNNLKRLLAYSSVAHAGYMLIGIAVAYPLSVSRETVANGVTALLFYLVAYVAMTVGAFGVLIYLSTPERPIEKEDDLAGLSQSHPGIALLMAIFLFSLIGIPLTAGFAGKLMLFWGALAERGGEGTRLFRWLAVIGVLNAAVGAYYYIRILGKMYLHPSIQPPTPRRASPALAALWLCALVTVVLGCYPALLMNEAARAAGAPGVAKTAAPANGGTSRLAVH